MTKNNLGIYLFQFNDGYAEWEEIVLSDKHMREEDARKITNTIATTNLQVKVHELEERQIPPDRESRQNMLDSGCLGMFLTDRLKRTIAEYTTD